MIDKEIIIHNNVLCNLVGFEVFVKKRLISLKISPTAKPIIINNCDITKKVITEIKTV
jgi:hypothetical protein